MTLVAIQQQQRQGVAIRPTPAPTARGLAIDSSNYAQYEFTDAILEVWRNLGVGLVLEQVLDPPPGYPIGRTRQHIGACLSFGMPVAPYAFWWAAAGTGYLRRQLDLLGGFEGRLVRSWADVEDTTVGRLSNQAGATLWQPLPREHLARITRQGPPPARDVDRAMRIVASANALADDIAAWFEVLDSFPTLASPGGLYSGAWYAGAYVDLGRFATRPWWSGDYDGIADPSIVQPWGGHVPPATIKQFQGSIRLGGYGGIDLNVLSENEIAFLKGVV